MRNRTALFLAAALAPLSGCINLHEAPATPELAKQTMPHVQLPEQWIAQGTRPEDVESGWLKEFNDPELSALASEALTYNADLKVVQARVEQARNLMEAAGGALLPTLTLGGKASGKLGTDGSGVNGAFLQASWEVDLWGRVRYGRLAATEQYASATADAAYARQSLVAALARAWFGAKEIMAQIDLTDQTIAASERFIELTQTRVRVGTANDSDLASAQASLAGYRDNRRDLVRAKEQALRAIEILLGPLSNGRDGRERGSAALTRAGRRGIALATAGAASGCYRGAKARGRCVCTRGASDRGALAKNQPDRRRRSDLQRSVRTKGRLQPLVGGRCKRRVGPYSTAAS